MPLTGTEGVCWPLEVIARIVAKRPERPAPAAAPRPAAFPVDILGETAGGTGCEDATGAETVLPPCAGR